MAVVEHDRERDHARAPAFSERTESEGMNIRRE